MAPDPRNEGADESEVDLREDSSPQEELYIVEGLEEADLPEPGAGEELLEDAEAPLAGQESTEWSRGDEVLAADAGEGLAAGLPDGMTVQEPLPDAGEDFDQAGVSAQGFEEVDDLEEPADDGQMGLQGAEDDPLRFPPRGAGAHGFAEQPEDVVNLSLSADYADSGAQDAVDEPESPERAASREFRERAARAAATRVDRAESRDPERVAVAQPYVVAPPRRRRRFALTSGLAAVVVVAGALVLLRQEDPGDGPHGGGPSVARTDIPRPSVSFTLPPPAVAFADGPEQEPVKVAGLGEAPGVEPAGETPTPADLAARAGGRPATDPVGGTPPIRPEIGRALDEALTAIPAPDLGNPGFPGEGEGPAIHANLPRGTQALAQLHNGNFFIGSVKKMESVWVTLDLPQGEVTFSHAELKRLMPLASADFRTLSQGVRPGSVRLKNSNRLVGQILRDQEGSVTIDLETAKITIPKENIDEVLTRPLSEFGFGDDEEEALFERDFDAAAPASRRAVPGKEGKEPPNLRIIVDEPGSARPGAPRKDERQGR